MRAERTREAWLRDGLAAWVAERVCDGAAECMEIPSYQVSCGWPRGARSTKRPVSVHGPEESSRGVWEVFVSPTMGNSAEVLGWAVHGLAHVLAGDAGHGKGFREAARALGMSTAGGACKARPSAAALLGVIGEEGAALGPYPHGAVSVPEVRGGNRYIKLLCLNEECGFRAHTSKMWAGRLDVEGATCPVCDAPEFGVAVNERGESK